MENDLRCENLAHFVEFFESELPAVRDALIGRLASVCAALHEETGDRGLLLEERAKLMQIAKKHSLLPGAPVQQTCK